MLVVDQAEDQLPSDLADAHAMIVALLSEALIRRLETEKLMCLIAKLRREQFGQSSERGRLLVEQLELAIADVEESQGAAEAEAVTAAPWQLTRRASIAPDDRPGQCSFRPANQITNDLKSSYCCRQTLTIDNASVDQKRTARDDNRASITTI